MLQQRLLGSAWEAEDAVLRAWEAGAPRCRRQLLEVGFLDGVAAGIHGCGGISVGGGEGTTVAAARARLRPHRGPERHSHERARPCTPPAVGAAVMHGSGFCLFT